MRNYFEFLKLLPKMLFNREPMLDSGSQAWIITNMFWAKTQQGDLRIFDEARLVLPIDAHFPARVMGPEEAAQSTFSAVQQHAGLGHWPARLVAIQTLDEPEVALDAEPDLEPAVSDALPEGLASQPDQARPLQITESLADSEAESALSEAASVKVPDQIPQDQLQEQAQEQPAEVLAGREQDTAPVAGTNPGTGTQEAPDSQTAADAQILQQEVILHEDVAVTEPEEPQEYQEYDESDHSDLDEIPTMVFEYDPVLVHNRDVMVASFAMGMASWWLGFTDPRSRPDPEGGALVELVAVMMGFGVFLANTAPQHKRPGCGACSDGGVERPAALSREEILFALALWCRNKGLGPRHVRPHLDTGMRALFREAWRLSRR